LPKATNEAVCGADNHINRLSTFRKEDGEVELARDRKSTRLNPVTGYDLVYRLLLEKKKKREKYNGIATIQII
jgi:hypothetical protein